jgi:hypothetical protein
LYALPCATVFQHALQRSAVLLISDEAIAAAAVSRAARGAEGQEDEAASSPRERQIAPDGKVGQLRLQRVGVALGSQSLRRSCGEAKVT